MTKVTTLKPPRKPGKMPDKPMSCRPLMEVIEEKLRTNEKGMIRKWLKCKAKELTR